MEHGLPISVFVNFVLLLALLLMAGRKPIREALQSRHDGVKKAVEEAEDLRRNVEKMLKEYEVKIAGLDAEIKRIYDEARAEGEQERKKILKRAEQTAERIRQEAVARAEKEIELVRLELEREIMAKAATAAIEILKRRATEADHKKFTDVMISKLEAGNGRGH